jgi:H+/Cl- antiporter ClcA
MADWLLNLPVLWLGVLIFGVVYLITAGMYLIVTALAVGDRARAFKAISPGILPPLSLLFGLLVGFLAAQDWTEASGLLPPSTGRRAPCVASCSSQPRFRVSPKPACAS